ncbi:lytic murein transglycosylase [Labrys monachus]|uniref:Lytic murein transglycosylase n=1 Tax=Labrys monachus TaxID=217067 RepID=A0ABU0F998_9HYPH|nr:lytic murein transglycosylase [Labrys monachus]MDQ0390630.1 lytic murein transglycosylase [Labrys monachus]
MHPRSKLLHVLFAVMAFAAFGLSATVAARAAQCGNDAAGFPAWLASFRQEAVSEGVSPGVVAAALDGVTYNTTVIRLDRTQHKTFGGTFEQFAAGRVTAGRVNKGRALMRSHAGMLASIESRFGVPPEILVAIWGMETDYGVVSGRMPVFRSLATLAYDCRRSDFFRNELMSALRIVQRGDESAGAMIGAWAGEIGQTQFLCSNYLKYAVDMDGNGRRDLIRSPADVLASTANLLKQHGWSAGGSYEPGSGNFSVLNDWNRSANYQRAIVLFAQKLKS